MVGPLLLLLVATPEVIEPDVIEFGRFDVPSILRITKSENKNEVHYGIRLNERCELEGPEPVFAYWREQERGPSALAELNFIEARVVGAIDQRVTSMHRVLFAIRAQPARTIVVQVRKGRQGCEARTMARVDGLPAQLSHIHAEIAAMQVSAVRIFGTTVRDRRTVVEELHP